ncbi:D-2-hydroxyglutarate dehydrogenase, mitochondrial, partial [Dionaea muscipula]
MIHTTLRKQSKVTDKDDSHHTAYGELGFQPNHTTRLKAKQLIHTANSGVPETLIRARAVYKYDLSLPVEKMYDLVEEIRARLGNSAIQNVNFHSLHQVIQPKYWDMVILGNDNLHLNISASQNDNAQRFTMLCGEGELGRRLPGKGQRVR